MSGGYFDQKRPGIGYGSGGYFPADPELDTQQLTPEQRETLLSMVANRTMQGAQSLMDFIDIPDAYLRGALSGRAGESVTPAEFLESWHSLPDADALGGWARPAAEFAAGLLVSPWNVIGGGISKAGGTALRAALPRSAQVAASRARIAANALDTSYARNALDSFRRNFNGKGVDTLTDLELGARPLVGPREAGRSQTLRDLAGAQANQQQAMDDLLDAAGSQARLNKQLDMPLRYDIGLKMPLSDEVLWGANIPGGEAFAQGMDRLGQISRWSSVGRAGNALTNKDLAGSLDEKGQIIGAVVGDAKRRQAEIGRRLVNQTIAPLAGVINQSADPAGLNRALRRALEGYPDPGDAALLAAHPEIGQFVNNWHAPGGLREQFIQGRRAMGLAGNEFEDEWGGMYFPRHTNDENFLDLIEEQGLAPQAVGARAHSAMTGDQLGRVPPMYTPGGTDFLNRLSRDDYVTGRARRATTDDDAAQHILGQVQAEIRRRYPTGRLPNGQPLPNYTLDQARNLAKILHQVSPETVGRLDLFGASPLEDLARYVVGNHQAAGVNEAIFDFLNGAARPLHPSAVPGGNHESIAQVLHRDLGINTIDNRGFMGPLPAGTPMFAGGRQQMEQRLQRFANAAGEVDLSNMSVDQDTVRRITKLKEYYARPELHNVLTKTVDAVNRIWKGPLLAWPAKFTRDHIGAVIMNLVEMGNPLDVINGYAATKHLMQGQLGKLDGFLAKVPRYAKIANPADRLKLYQEDLAAYDLMGRGRSLDQVGASQDIQHGTHTIDQFVPGMNPDTTLGYQLEDTIGMLAGGQGPLHPRNAAYSELFNAENWMPRRFFRGLWDERNNTNAITRYGARQGDITDKINRLAGYNGLLLQGYNPREAARRATKLHIDYSSLTAFERDALRRAAPFYAYTSRMSMNAAEKILENPTGRYSQLTMRLPQTIMGNSDEEEGYVPESIRNSYGLPNAFLGTPFGGAKEGVQPWLTDIDIPGIDQINMFQPVFNDAGGLDASGTLFKSVEDAIGKNASPLIKATTEMLTGIDTFTKRPIKDMDTAGNQIAEELFGIHPDSMYGQYIRSAKPLLDMAPFAPRLLQVANRMTDDEKVPDIRDRAWQTGLNMFSGVKIQNVDDQTRRRDARKKIAEMLDDDPLVRSFQQPFIPKEALPYADPELVELMALDRQLSRELKKERDLQKGIAPVTKRRKHTLATGYFE